jgi:hypothetical protein
MDERLLRAIQSVSYEFDNERPHEKEGAWIASALKGLHVLSCCVAPAFRIGSRGEMENWLDLHRAVSKLIRSADRLFSDERTPLKDAMEVRWAIRGLVTRLKLANSSLLSGSRASNATTAAERLSFATPNINVRTSRLPFDILPHCLPWEMDSESRYYIGYPSQSMVSDLLRSIPFNFDTLTTRTGDSITERRGTAWLAEDGIGALAYSGKLMRPSAVPEWVSGGVMREIERSIARDMNMRGVVSQKVNLGEASVEIIWDDVTTNNLPFLELGRFSRDVPTFFDCALCNHYPDGDSACKFHTDPEHGSHWHRTTAVVSAGSSRKFAFRPIPGVSAWDEWDPSLMTVRAKGEASCAPAAVQLFPGDVVFMAGACNDLFHHAVYASPFDGVGNNSRVSLVLKRALDRGGGKKGHSLAGEGRRSRRNM